MKKALVLAIAGLCGLACRAATFGTVVSVTGGLTDIVLDESRNRLYFVDTTQNRVDIYSIAQKKLLSPITVGTKPLSAAISRDNKYLYVTIYSSSALEVIDLDTSAVVKRVTLPAAPEGVAVGGDGRVLITTVGSGSSNSENRLLLYNPNLTGEDALLAVATTLTAPTTPATTTTSSRVYMTTRSNLTASRDGNWIIGLNNPSTSARQMFVFEVASGSILRSRTLTSISNVLAVSPNGDRFMAGYSLFDTETLAIPAQQNTANSMFPFVSSANFSTQSNQGGAVFAPDMSVVYSAFNITPVTNLSTSTTGSTTTTTTTVSNTSQLFLSDPDNLLIKLGIQLPENLTGKMVITADGKTIYALSQSGFTIIPVSTIYDYPIVEVENPVALLTYDQCGVTSSTRSSRITVRNAGKGRLIPNAVVYTSTAVSFTFAIASTAGTTIGVPSIGGGGGTGIAIGGGGIGGGAGGGAPGISTPITLPTTTTGQGGGQVMIPPGTGATSTTSPTGGTGFDTRGSNLSTTQQAGISGTAPSVRTIRGDTETIFEFSYNTAGAARSIGTQTPTEFLIVANEAINIPPRIRVYQNYRNAEATGEVQAVVTSVSTNEALVDLVMDSTRQRVYIANSGMNRVEVFDAKSKRFLAPIKVGQLPRSLAMTPDARYLYVANSGGESISIIDLNVGAVTGKVKFPPVYYNASFSLITPSIIAWTLSGLQVMMSSGAMWTVINDEAMPRKSSAVLGTSTITSPRSLVATPGGEYALLLSGSGVAYLYDAATDDFVVSQSVVATPIQSYFGPVAAGPRGQYYVVNGNILNASLTPITATTTTSTTGGAGGGTTPGGGTMPGGGTLPGGGTMPGGGITGGFGVTAASTSTTSSRPVAAVAAVNSNTIARFITPTRSTANATVSTAPTIELIDVNSLTSRTVASALEGPLSSQVGSQRVNVNGRTMVVDADATTAYVLTTSGLSVVPLTSTATQTAGATPAINMNGVVNTANYTARFAPGSIVSIFGQNLASEAKPSTANLPTMLGGVCVTLDSATALPIFMTSPAQINVHLPPSTSAGTHTLMIRAPERSTTSVSYPITVSKYAPAVFINESTGMGAIYRADGSAVSKDNKAKRDETLTIYAVGLGATTGAAISAGVPTPSTPAANTAAVKVFFGDPNMKQSEMIVNSSVLVPGEIGIYRISVTVPGFHEKGDSLPVTVRIGGVDSPTTGDHVPTVAVE